MLECILGGSVAHIITPVSDGRALPLSLLIPDSLLPFPLHRAHSTPRAPSLSLAYLNAASRAWPLLGWAIGQLLRCPSFRSQTSDTLWVSFLPSRSLSGSAAPATSSTSPHFCPLLPTFFSTTPLSPLIARDYSIMPGFPHTRLIPHLSTRCASVLPLPLPYTCVLSCLDIPRLVRQLSCSTPHALLVLL